MADFPLQFEQPGWLLLLLLIIPVYMIARTSAGAMGRVKATVIFAFRLIVILLITTALSNPTWERRGEGLTVTVILDRSYSIPLPLKESAYRYLRDAAEHTQHPQDRVGTVVVGKDAAITALPRLFSQVDVGFEGDVDRTATNLAAGIRLALAIAPDDTANRIVLASDGNETIDSALAAAELARANNVPIDVLILEYEHENEVLFDRIVAPSTARLGQTATVRMVLRSQSHAEGTLTLRKNGEPLDLDPDRPGHGRRIALEPGVTVLPVTVRFDDQGPARFEAHFEPTRPEHDTIAQNNSALAVTFVEGEGRVLVIEDAPVDAENLVQALVASDIAVDRQPPEFLTGGLVQLSGYDAIILANVPRWMFGDDQDRMLHAYVHDIGGGLIMLGGPQSFGAGGWIDSKLADALPVRMDPPQTRQMPRGALALVMHSCEMPQGNYWSQEVARAAINALSSQDYIGIIEYDWRVRERMGATLAFPMQIAGDKSAALAATRQLVVGDTKDFGPLFQLAYDELTNVRAGQKHMIVISDGDPAAPPPALMRRIINEGITITTVMVIGHGSTRDRQKMELIAANTGGRFYHVINPNQLPQIFIKEAQVVARSLIQEGENFQPQVVSLLPGPIEGFAQVPPIQGYVLAAKRDGLAQTPIIHRTEEGDDPIYAHWNYGLGKAIAYTSDVMGRWGTQWLSWADFMAYWSQSVRWVMRPSDPANMMINTRLDGDTAIVEVEALEADASFLNFLQTRGTVLRPDGEAERLPLQQIGPGRYRGEFQVVEPGAYLTSVHYSAGVDEDSQGTIQAAVTVPYAQEYRSITHNAPLLRQLAATTGGRVLPAGLSPEDLNLFDREHLDVPASAKHIWDLLAILAAAIFLFDVAMRRLAIDWEWMFGVFKAAVGRRSEATGGTVEAWRKTREQVTGRMKPAERKGEQPDRTARFEASEEDAAHAIDVGAEGADQPTGEPLRPRSGEESKKADDQAKDEGPHTSRLLAAKRRARGEGGGERGGDQSDQGR